MVEGVLRGLVGDPRFDFSVGGCFVRLRWRENGILRQMHWTSDPRAQ
jgi:hypothetical protein